MEKVKSLIRVKKNYRRTIRSKAVNVLRSNKYKVLSKVGSGSFGDVVALKTAENQEAAAKIVLQECTSLLEFTEWHKLEHANILPLLKIIRQPDYNIFITPLYERTVSDFSEDIKFWSSETSYEVSKKWMSDVFRGLDYLHSMDICHLDVQAENIMISPDMSAVIGDFSYSSKNTESVRIYGLKAFSRPPEAGNCNGHCLEVDGKSFDIWSFGMLGLKLWSSMKFPELVPDKRESWENCVYPLLFKSLQFPNFCKAFKEKFPNVVLNASELLKTFNLIRGCLRYRQEDRPKTSLILQHPMISKETKVLLEPDNIWSKYLTWPLSAEILGISKAENDCPKNYLPVYDLDCTTSFGGQGDASSTLTGMDTNAPEMSQNEETVQSKAVKKKCGGRNRFQGWCRRAWKIVRSRFFCTAAKKEMN